MLKRMICLSLCLSILVILLPNFTVFAQERLAYGDYSEGIRNETNIYAMTNVVLTDNGLKIDGSKESTRRVSFDIFNLTSEIEPMKNYYMEFTYLDNGDGFFFVEYNNSYGNTVYSDVIYCDNSGEVKQSVVKITNPKIDINASAADFKINTAYDYTARQNYSKSPVYISGIEFYTDDTYTDAAINIQSPNSGNIFYTGEIPSFDIELKNLRSTDRSLEMTYNVYGIDKRDEKSLVSSSNEIVDVLANGTLTRYVESETDKYGRYMLEVIAKSDEYRTNSKTEAEFSYCVYADAKSSTFGINTHTVNGRGSADIIFPMAKNAGIGMTRETINWESYEPTIGNFNLDEQKKKSLNTMKREGIEPIIILYGNNRAYEAGDFVTESNMKNYKNYIKKFLSEPEMSFVKNIEVYNEPDLKEKCVNTDISDNDELKGSYYAAMEKTAYETIKEIRPDIEVGAYSFCRITNTALTEKFLDSASADLWKYQTESGKIPFDYVSVHPYIGEINPEKGFHGSNSSYCDFHNLNHGWIYTYSVQDMVEYWRGVIEKAGFNQNSLKMYVTEYGNTSAADDGDLATNEHEQAQLNLRMYLTMKSVSFNQKNYMYDFMDDGLRQNTREHNFGMVRNEAYRVPYAAKATYLSTAALNRFLDGADSAEIAYNNDYHNIVKFNEPDKDRTVYALWTTNKTENSLAFDFGTNNLSFYDMYGNELSNTDVTDKSGNYILSDEPYYVVVGSSMNFPKKPSADRATSIAILSDGEEINDETFKNFNPTDVSAEITFGADFPKGDYVLICAFYNKGAIENIKTVNGIYDPDEMSKAKFDISMSTNIEVDSVKIMIWDSLEKIKPQSGAVRITDSSLIFMRSIEYGIKNGNITIDGKNTTEIGKLLKIIL